MRRKMHVHIAFAQNIAHVEFVYVVAIARPGRLCDLRAASARRDHNGARGPISNRLLEAYAKVRMREQDDEVDTARMRLGWAGQARDELDVFFCVVLTFQTPSLKSGESGAPDEAGASTAVPLFCCLTGWSLSIEGYIWKHRKVSARCDCCWRRQREARCMKTRTSVKKNN